MIDKLPYGFINSVYGFNDYTLNELICKLAQKMDEVITQSNESFNYLDWLKGQGLSDEVIKILLDWKENGTLETIINENIFNGLNTKIDNFVDTMEIELNKVNSQLDILKNNAFCITDYGGVGDGITDNTEVLKTIISKINVISKNGGAIFLPQGEFLITNDLLINKKVTIFGLGNATRIKLGGKITVDNNPYNSLRIQDMEIETITSTACFDIFKNVTNNSTINQSLNTDLIFTNVHFYTELDTGKFIDIKQTCDSIFSNCIFQSKTNNSGYDGIYFSSYDKKGVRNPVFNCCKFVGLNYCVKAIGVPQYYQYTCGIRFLGCFIMDSNYGIYAKDIDWLTFENGMIDYTDHPIITHNVSNLKVKNNYLFSRRKEISSSCVEVVFEDTTERFFPEIVGNHMWNSSYGNLNGGVTTCGITIKAIANTKNCTVKGAIIGQNTIHRVTKCINLETINSNGYTATITYCNINNNNFYMANRGIYATDGIIKSIAPNNTFNTIVKDIETSSEIPLSNIVTKELEVTITPENDIKEVATGVPLNRIISVELIYNDNVFTYDVSVFLKNTGNIICRKRNTSYDNFTVKVLVKYYFTY